MSASNTAAVTEVDWTGASARRLAGYSFLILFFELALIRYLPGYVRVFGFYLNFVLIATFLGMGVGLLRAEAALRLRWLSLPVTVVLLVAVYLLADVLVQVPPDADEVLWAIYPARWETKRTFGVLPTTTILFALCALFFVPLGALLGREFRKFKPLVAYSLDIGGSLAGILAFGVLSALRTAPAVWFAIGTLIWLVLAWEDRRYAVGVVGMGLAAVVLALVTAGPRPEFWSPYYRINIYRPDDDVFRLTVNGSLHQYMIDFRPPAVARSPFVDAVRNDYMAPYRALRNVDSVLVIGAGTGNDVALLLDAGVAHIDAVEIDPVIVSIGQSGNPQDPYGDPRVRVHIDDARAFMDRTDQRYDLIVFGTLDSQTLLSGMTSLRLDNYVYTVEAFEAARERLKPDGTLITYHMSLEPYIGAKILGLIERAFGEEPAVSFEPAHRLFNYTFIAGAAAERLAEWETPANIADISVVLPRDDWPYLYLRRPTLPDHYIRALAMVLAVAAVFVAVGLGRRRLGGTGFDWPLFFMGAGFLLVETKSVSEISLLFGATWTVNLVVFYSILSVILIANLWVLRHPPTGTRWPFLALFASLALAYTVPASALLPLGVMGRWVVGGMLIALPILFAAVIFAVLFRTRTRDATASLAANLLGAIVGGVLEYAAMVVGIKALYLLAAVCYGLVVLTSLRRGRPAATVPVAADM
jgi:protein-L-isoaspartate O-methyltransferase